jgi:hypothetical protein
MEQNKLIRWIVLAVAAWFIFRSVRRVQLLAPTVGGGGDNPRLPPTAPPSGNPLLDRPSVDSGDVAGDVDNGEPDFWLENFDYANRLIKPGLFAELQDRFYRQMYLPASLIPISVLGRDDFVLAMKMLAGVLTPGGCQLAQGESRQKEMDDAEGDAHFAIEIVNAILAVVAAIVTVFCAPAGVALGAALGALSAEEESAFKEASDGDKKRAAEALATAQAAFQKISAGDRETLARWIGPVMATGDRFPRDWPGGPNPLFNGVSLDSAPATLWASRQGFTFYPRFALTSFNVQRFALLWNSAELACSLPLRQRVNRRARIYRALDVIGCLMFPSERHVFNPTTGEQEGVQDDRLYSYLSGRALPVIGSIFPPRAAQGDTRFPGHASGGFPPPRPPQNVLEVIAGDPPPPPTITPQVAADVSAPPPPALQPNVAAVIANEPVTPIDPVAAAQAVPTYNATSSKLRFA